ncbi:tetratricopeptide repeat protein, partial [Chloroflexota bacterium]
GRKLVRAAEYAADQGRHDQARALARMALSVPLTRFTADDADQLGRVGLLCERAEEFELAARYYEQMAVLQPESDWPVHRLALLDARAGRYQEAERILLRAVDTIPEHEGALVTLGWVYLSQGKLNEARLIVGPVIASGSSPSWKAWAHWLSAQLHLRQNEAEFAFEDIKECARLRISLNMIDDVIRMYEEALTIRSLSPHKRYFEEQIRVLRSGGNP